MNNNRKDAYFSAYQREKAWRQDLQEQLSKKEAQWSEQDADADSLERQIRELCEDILSRGRLSTQKQSNWKQMPLKELVGEAQKGFRLYASRQKDLLKQIQTVSEQRRIEIDSLNAQIEYMRQTPGKKGTGKEHADSDAGRERRKEEALKKASPKIADAVHTGRIQVTVEENDADREAEELEQMMLKETEAESRRNPRAGKKAPSEGAGQPKSGKEAAPQLIYRDDLMEAVGTLTDTELSIIRALGETGISLQTEILSEMVKRNVEYSRDVIRKSLTKLLNGRLVETENLNTPFHKNTKLFRLSVQGRLIYRERFGKDPVKSEWERVVAEHTTTEHGYGIAGLAKELERHEYLNKIRYMGNRKEAIDLKNGQRSIPDLVCECRNGNRIYLEYEVGTTNDTDFISKCAKITKYTNLIRIVVPNETALKKVGAQVRKFIEMRREGLGRCEILVTTAQLAARNDLRKPGEWKYYFNPGETGAECRIQL